MLGISDFSLFIGAVMLLNITPGPDMAFIVGQTVARGKRAGVLAALGATVGGGVHTLACAFGLSALIAASPMAFTVIKWLGALYLVYIGIQTLREARRTVVVSDAGHPAVRPGSLLARGFVTNVTNPKVFLFYIAFLPQFIDPESSHKTAALLMLGATLVALGFVTDCAVVGTAAKASKLLGKSRAASRRLKQVVGVGFIGLGLRLAAVTR